MKGFISYAHDDHKSFQQFELHVRAIERAYRINFWSDKRIKAGNYWNTKIAKAIEDSHIHILLFSPAYIYSDYIFEKELPAIEARCKTGSLVLPVILERCSWNAFVDVLQAAPINERGRLTPINDWSPRKNGFDAARHQITQGIVDRFKLVAIKPFKWGTR